MYKDKSLGQIKTFMLTMGQTVLNSPTIPDSKICNLRYNLIKEENEELLEASFELRNIVEVADALADLQVVLDGAFHAFGLANIKEQLLDEVFRSNMSKVCNSREEAEQTIVKCINDPDLKLLAKDLEAHKVDNSELWVVKKVSDGKIMKSINYFKPNLKEIVEKALNSQS